MNERYEIPSSSSLGRLVQCSASHNMGVLANSWGQNKELPSADKDFGLRIHEALQSGTSKLLQTDEERMAYSVMDRLRHKFIKGWRESKHLLERDTKELREHRMYLRNDGVTPVFTGQADYITMAERVALILDYKSLWNTVPQPKDNHQLKSLAVLLWLEHQNLAEITVQIISPHHDYEMYVMRVPELRQYLKFLEDTLKSVNQAKEPTPGTWCKYCRGMLICPAVKKTARDLLAYNGELPSKLPKGEAGAKMLDDMAIMSALVDRIRDHYKTVISQDSDAIPGWTLQTRIARKFRDVRNVFRMLKDKYQDEVFDLVTISVAKAFEKLNPVEQGTLEDCIERTESSPALVKRKPKDNGIQEV